MLSEAGLYRAGNQVHHDLGNLSRIASSRSHRSGKLRVEAADATLGEEHIARREGMAADEIQDGSIDRWPQGLHQVKDQRKPTWSGGMQVPDRGIEPSRERRRPNL